MAETVKQRDCSYSLSILLRKYTVFTSATLILLMKFSFLFSLTLYFMFILFYFCQN